MGECAPTYNVKKAETCAHSFMSICDCPWVCRFCGVPYRMWASGRMWELEQKVKELEEEIDQMHRDAAGEDI